MKQVAFNKPWLISTQIFSHEVLYTQCCIVPTTDFNTTQNLVGKDSQFSRGNLKSTFKNAVVRQDQSPSNSIRFHHSEVKVHHWILQLVKNINEHWWKARETSTPLGNLGMRFISNFSILRKKYLFIGSRVQNITLCKIKEICYISCLPS